MKTASVLKTRNSTLLALLIAATVVVALFIILSRQRTGSNHSEGGNEAGSKDPTQTRTELLQKVLALEAKEAEWNRTIWAPEIEAQRHEEIFIQLWDALRRSADATEVLKNFAFEELRYGTPTMPEKHEHEIERSYLKPPLHTVSRTQWHSMLEAWKKAGYRLEQSEWRHVRFETNNRSTFTFELHILNTNIEERVICRGKLNVEWLNSAQDQSILPRSLEVAEVELLRRKGVPFFKKVFSKSIVPNPGSRFIDPLIVADLDGDGLPEVILACKNLVLRNQGGGRLISSPLCNPSPDLPYAAVLAEVNGDNFVDLVYADKEGLLIYSGKGEARFFQSPKRVRFSSEPLLNPFVMTAGDIEGDGDSDLFLAQYKLPYVQGQMPTPYYDANDGFPSFLLLNDGTGNFKEVTEVRGLGPKRFRRTYSASFVDLNEDNRPELLVVSDFAGADLYFNDGKGFFKDVSDQTLGEHHLFGMAHTFGDYNRDGLSDIFVIGMGSATAQRLDHLNLGFPGRPLEQEMRRKMTHGNRLYLNDGKKFRQTELSDQVANAGWAWGVTSFDFDNDGDLDLYLGNGHKSGESTKDYCPQFWCHDIYCANSQTDPARALYFQTVASKRYAAGQSYGGYDKNRLFINQDGKSFLEAGFLMGAALEVDCRSVVSEDLDLDGNLDLIVTTSEIWPVGRQQIHILKSSNALRNSWIGFRPEKGSHFPPGTKIFLATSSGKQIYQQVTGDGYRSQESGQIHFGLGKNPLELEAEIQWPGKGRKRIEGLKVNQYNAIGP